MKTSCHWSDNESFLLGYHYLTGTHADAASKQFKLAQTQLPDDKLLTQLVGMTTPADESKKSEAATPPELPVVPPEKMLSAEKLVGSWKASSQGATFQLDLAKDGSFVWTYSRGKDKQTMKGVFAVDQILAILESPAEHNAAGRSCAMTNIVLGIGRVLGTVCLPTRACPTSGFGV